MYVEISLDSREALRPLFRDYPHMPGCIEAALEGRVGTAIVDDPTAPTAAILQIDFFFLAGNPASPGATRLVRTLRPGQPAIIAPSAEWILLLRKELGPRLASYPRVSFRCGPLNRLALQSMVAALPLGYRMARIATEEQVEQFAYELTDSLVGNYASAADFLAHGVGFAIEHKGHFVAGISSFAMSSRTLEIEVQTHRNHRCRGLGSALGAHMILYCLEHGLTPSWDAANLISAALASKLGFIPHRRYDAYYLPSEPSAGRL